MNVMKHTLTCEKQYLVLTIQYETNANSSN